MTELRGFKFQIILVLEFKKLENDYKTKYGSFYSHSKAETIINEVPLMMYLFQSILQFYHTC